MAKTCTQTFYFGLKMLIKKIILCMFFVLLSACQTLTQDKKQSVCEKAQKLLETVQQVCQAEKFDKK